MRVRLKTNAAEIAREVGGFTPVMLQRIAGAIDDQNLLSIAYTQVQKLKSGPPYLHVRRARLYKSVLPAKTRITGQRVVGSYGTNVRYAGVHEYGFKGTVQVQTFSRQIPPNRFGLGGEGGGTEQVRAHSRRVKFKARHMFRDGLEDTAQDYADKISAAIVEAWKE